MWPHCSTEMSKLSLHLSSIVSKNGLRVQSSIVSKNGLKVQLVLLLLGTELAGLSLCCCIAVSIHACFCKSSLHYHAVRVSAMLEVFGVNQHACRGYCIIFYIYKFG